MRFNAELSDDMSNDVKKYIPAGNQSAVIRKLFQLLFKACKQNPMVVYLLLADKVELNLTPDCSTIEHKENK